jgi:serine/threonine protein phosphatase PrpC
VTTLAAFGARSDVGRQRTGNEDRYLARPPVFAVADGMGGHQAGEVASTIAVEALEAATRGADGPDGRVVVDSLERSNRAIRDRASERPELAGMGTTCTVALVADGVVRIGHVGDSRAYLFRDGSLAQLTEDHSLVASMVREGIIDPDDALTDGRRNIITRALGAEDDVRIDQVTTELRPGDRLLLCTDGLTGQVPEPDIVAVLAAEGDPEHAAQRLVDAANAAGGDDNVTVIVVDPDRLAPAAVTSAVAVEPPDPSGLTAQPEPATNRKDGSTARSPSKRSIGLLALGVLALGLLGWGIAGLAGGAPAGGVTATPPVPTSAPSIDTPMGPRSTPVPDASGAPSGAAPQETAPAEIPGAAPPVVTTP